MVSGWGRSGPVVTVSILVVVLPLFGLIAFYLTRVMLRGCFNASSFSTGSAARS
jgi:hypothetical protein